MADPTPQPGLKEELARAIKEMETRAGSFSEAEVFDKVRDVLSNKQVSKEDFALYQGESNAFIFSSQAEGGGSFSRILPTDDVVSQI